MKPYRKNVGIVVFNSKGEVLTGERVNFIGSWQFPQGGIDKGEEPEEAARRELYEEMGIDTAELIYESPDWISYDFPPNLNIKELKKYKGQIQKWFLFYWDHPAQDCRLDVHEVEFGRAQFMPLKETIHSIVSFKKEVYEKIIQIFEPEIKKFLESKKL